MDASIISAIIAGVVAIIGPIITIFVKKYLDTRSKLSIPAERRQAITGRWKGIVHQVIKLSDRPVEIPVIVNLVAGRKIVSGRIHIETVWEGEKRKADFNASGAFIYGAFLHLSYTPSDSSVMQFGSLVLQLDPTGTVLEGRFAGYGQISKAIVGGTIRLEKTD